ncbi:sensor histidine kinase [Weizmannia coagulans]|uniref:histidine kinase n=2 Tax=Heyndrickxia TaxID=2837504 RepID=A0AAN0WBS2_HEYCO|nr:MULTISPECIES: sensor histidine kinase [Heyndrickxia]AJO23130.1 integral membrane sensor signal transduction histidine kinase [Heyndrickxia coagulans]AKN55366.1 Two-component sensor histidine kinase BceS [Heyndrickxia coagulans]ATW83307.1 sensor histidine kinase [Heyndrickxia coagulans]KGB28178.1 histidine kinase [Heyndrickxia coagulans]KXT19906.1 histidine kinase [Heyndrickxia coagulans]
MIRMFLVERKSWVIFFAACQLMLLFIAWLDPQIALSSVLYIVFLETIAFLLFLFFRARKEVKFYQSLSEWDGDLDTSEITRPRTPFEQIVHQAVQAQAEHLRAETDRNASTVQEEQDELTAWVHEVKTPMTAMQLIIDRLQDEEAKVSLNYEWLRIHHLLDKQLHEKRIGNMENDVYMENVDLKRLIFQEIKAIQPWCIQKGIGFDVSPGVPAMVTDAKWLSFILRQLLVNAVQYSCGTDISISGKIADGRFQLSVADKGRGIDPKDLPRIFEKGFTSSDRSQNRGATGLGLYLAKRAAEKLNILLTVQSVPGAGSTFTLIFPERNSLQQITGM